MRIQERITELFHCTNPTVNRSRALIYFKHRDITKTCKNIGHCLEDIHKALVCKPEYIGFHTVDEASNSGSSVDNLEWYTSGVLSQKIVAGACDYQKSNTTSSQYSETIYHKINLNPELVTPLNNIHD